MPIRFACPHCQQKLSVSSRKAGTTADCPRCKRSIAIPAPSLPAAVGAVALAPNEADAQPESEAVAQAADAEAGPAAFPSFVVYDSPELVYDTSDEHAATSRHDEPPDLIAVP